MSARRSLVIAILATNATGLALAPNRPQIKKLEQASGGRLGVAVLDTSTGILEGYRAGERFPMCSTFKLLAIGAVLSKVDHGQEKLGRIVQFSNADLVAHSPVTNAHAGRGMSIEALCQAAMSLSDNTAANLLVAGVGGPHGVTKFARSLGHKKLRLDRTEPELNDAVPGDPRDTTTPTAMLTDLRKLTLGTQLSPASRSRLVGWMQQNKTGDSRLRAGLPRSWMVGDKTGSGDHGTSNDVAIVRPPHRKPILVVVFLTGATQDDKARDATIAAIGQLFSKAYRVRKSSEVAEH